MKKKHAVLMAIVGIVLSLVCVVFLYIVSHQNIYGLSLPNEYDFIEYPYIDLFDFEKADSIIPIREDDPNKILNSAVISNHQLTGLRCTVSQVAMMTVDGIPNDRYVYLHSCFVRTYPWTQYKIESTNEFAENNFLKQTADSSNNIFVKYDDKRFDDVLACAQSDGFVVCVKYKDYYFGVEYNGKNSLQQCLDAMYDELNSYQSLGLRRVYLEYFQK
ncbi:MAG: hypothetical protein LBQ80_02385 [Clostridium sp.]|jgi:hypothetical protein|nr:hypothetical protein [Clostridium sp.]